MTRTTLDQDELDILEAFAAGEFQSELSEARLAFLTQAAEETCKKDKRINIRISSHDLEALQRPAQIRFRWIEGYGDDKAPDKTEISYQSATICGLFFPLKSSL